MEGTVALYCGKNHLYQTKKLRSADADAVKLIATAHLGYRVTEEFRMKRFPDDARLAAQDARANMEFDAGLNSTGNEIVLLEADSEDTVRLKQIQKTLCEKRTGAISKKSCRVRCLTAC